MVVKVKAEEERKDRKKEGRRENEEKMGVGGYREREM